MTQKKKKPKAEELKDSIDGPAEPPIEIPHELLDGMVDRMLRILNPEVLYSRHPEKMTEEALNRCRYRARDLLHTVSTLLPINHPISKKIDEALSPPIDLPFVERIDRDSPGERSDWLSDSFIRARKSKRVQEAYDLVTKLSREFEEE